jgi:hypothetical protein
VAACGGVAVDDMVVHAVGGLATIAERTLFATGRGLTPAEIAALVAGPDRVEDLRVVLGRDRRFVRVSADVYELAEWGNAATPASPAPPGATVPAGTGIDGRWWLRVPVDAGVLRGVNLPLSDGLLDVASVMPDHRRTFASRYGPVTIIDEGPSPGLGSLRHVALACGAQPGDELWLGFGRAGDVSVRRRDGDQLRQLADERVVPDPAPVSLTAQGAS